MSSDHIQPYLCGGADRCLFAGPVNRPAGRGQGLGAEPTGRAAPNSAQNRVYQSDAFLLLSACSYIVLVQLGLSEQQTRDERLGRVKTRYNVGAVWASQFQTTRTGEYASHVLTADTYSRRTDYPRIRSTYLENNSPPWTRQMAAKGRCEASSVGRQGRSVVMETVPMRGLL